MSPGRCWAPCLGPWRGWGWGRFSRGPHPADDLAHEAEIELLAVLRLIPDRLREIDRRVAGREREDDAVPRRVGRVRDLEVRHRILADGRERGARWHVGFGRALSCPCVTDLDLHGAGRLWLDHIASPFATTNMRAH